MSFDRFRRVLFGRSKAPIANEATLQNSTTPTEDQFTNCSSLELPLEYDPQFYRASHVDLAKMSEDELCKHYSTYGMKEGRIASRAATRENFLSLVPVSQPTLEIGPFSNPCLTGSEVRYFDVLDKPGLVARAKAIGLDYARVPEIDFVSPTGDLAIVPGPFGSVLSSHCIEHQPDLVHHLNQIARVLGRGGFYFLIIPDKRYCFDHFLPESTIADVLDAHLARRELHSARSIIEHRSLTTHNDPLRHWNSDHGSPLPDNARIAAALAEIEAKQGEYVDVHAWQFTPESFRAIIGAIKELGLAPLSPLRIYQTPFGRIEFCAVLQSS